MINQVTIIIVTEIKTVNSCIVASLGKSDHQIVYLVPLTTVVKVGLFLYVQSSYVGKNNQNVGDFIFQPGPAAAYANQWRRQP